MRSLPDLDDFPYVEQDEDLPLCVPACVEMVYQYLGVSYDFEELRRDLHWDAIRGTDFMSIGTLTVVDPVYVKHLEEVEVYLAGGYRAPAEARPVPVIANIYAPDDAVLGYLLNPESPLHAVVVLSVEPDRVKFVDPLSYVEKSTRLEQECARREFARAWMDGFALLPR
jgi:hypothetical protein